MRLAEVLGTGEQAGAGGWAGGGLRPARSASSTGLAHWTLWDRRRGPEGLGEGAAAGSQGPGRAPPPVLTNRKNSRETGAQAPPQRLIMSVMFESGPPGFRSRGDIHRPGGGGRRTTSSPLPSRRTGGSDTSKPTRTGRFREAPPGRPRWGELAPGGSLRGPSPSGVSSIPGQGGRCERVGGGRTGEARFAPERAVPSSPLLWAKRLCSPSLTTRRETPPVVRGRGRVAVGARPAAGDSVGGWGSYVAASSKTPMRRNRW